jgi:hypothetical protein
MKRTLNVGPFDYVVLCMHDGCMKDGCDFAPVVTTTVEKPQKVDKQKIFCH